MILRTQSGMTLVELLVATVIGGVIFGALTQVAITAFRTTDATAQRLAASSDSQLVSTFFLTDAQSAESVAIGSGAARYEAETYCAGNQASGSGWSGGKFVYPSSGSTISCSLPALATAADTWRVAFVKKIASYTGTLIVDGVSQTPNCTVAPGSGTHTCVWTGSYAAALHALVAGGLDTTGTSGIDYIEPVTCGAVSPLLRLAWTDRGTTVSHVVTYSWETAASENQLVRRHCTNGGATAGDQQTLVRSPSSSPAATATCQPSNCVAVAGQPVRVALTWNAPPLSHETQVQSFTLSASTRVG